MKNGIYQKLPRENHLKRGLYLKKHLKIRHLLLERRLQQNLMNVLLPPLKKEDAHREVKTHNQENHGQRNVQENKITKQRNYYIFKNIILKKIWTIRKKLLNLSLSEF